MIFLFSIFLFFFFSYLDVMTSFDYWFPDHCNVYSIIVWRKRLLWCSVLEISLFVSMVLFFFFFEIDNSLKFLCILNHEEEKQFGTPILAPLVLVPDWQAISCIDFHFFLFFLLKNNIRQKPDIFIIKLYINFTMFVGKW